MKSTNVDVVVGEGTVTVKREGSNRAVLAKILGTVEVDGIEVICLDRLVHESHESTFGEWALAGAVTTLLSRAIATAGAV